MIGVNGRLHADWGRAVEIGAPHAKFDAMGPCRGARRTVMMTMMIVVPRRSPAGADVGHPLHAPSRGRCDNHDYDSCHCHNEAIWPRQTKDSTWALAPSMAASTFSACA
jgi:hypothetical protein